MIHHSLGRRGIGSSVRDGIGGGVHDDRRTGIDRGTAATERSAAGRTGPAVLGQREAREGHDEDDDGSEVLAKHLESS